METRPNSPTASRAHSYFPRPRGQIWMWRETHGNGSSSYTDSLCLINSLRLSQLLARSVSTRLSTSLDPSLTLKLPFFPFYSLSFLFSSTFLQLLSAPYMTLCFWCSPSLRVSDSIPHFLSFTSSLYPALSLTSLPYKCITCQQYISCLCRFVWIPLH